MRLAIFTLLSLTVACSCVLARTDALTGNYEFSAENDAGSLTLLVACQSESQCTFTNTSQGKGRKPYVNKQGLAVRAAAQANVDAAAWSLAYAVRNYAAAHTAQDDVMLVERLRDVFSAGPSVTACWTLSNEPVPMLACAFKGVPPNAPPLYLFVGSMSNCREPNDAFCGYAIFPLSGPSRADSQGKVER